MCVYLPFCVIAEEMIYSAHAFHFPDKRGLDACLLRNINTYIIASVHLCVSF